MSQPELVNKIVNALTTAGVDYMFTGSIVSSIQGEPRLSHDIDIVVDLKLAQSAKLIRSLPQDDFYCSDEAIKDAIKRRSMFNVLPLNEDEKVDLKDDAYDRTRFSRKYVSDLFGIKVKVSKPEDTILYKLKWAELSGGSEKQFKNVLRVYEIQFKKLDVEYLNKWASFLKVSKALERVRSEAKPLK